MASTLSKKRARSTRTNRQTARKPELFDADQMKELMKQAVREVLEEHRLEQPQGVRKEVDGDWLEEARRVRAQIPRTTPSADLLRGLREKRASR